MESRDVSRVFAEARQSGVALAMPAPPIAEAAPVSAPAPEGEGAGRPAAESEGPDAFGVMADSDFAFTPARSDLCAGGGSAEWTCFDGSGGRYAGVPQPHMDNDNVRAGLLFSTVRLVLAYDRQITEHVALGLRLGMAFNGGPTPPGGSAFLPLHAEARVTYRFRPWLLPALRPFVFAGGGLEEVDTRVSVLVVEVPCTADYSPRCARHVDAWHRAGYGFFGGGAGMRYALGPRSGVVADVRAGATLGTLTFVATPEIGATYAF
jgi:hypothetical protein